jgi:hypothetical protein
MAVPGHFHQRPPPGRCCIDYITGEVHGAGSLPRCGGVTFWNGILWLHLLGMATFVGGQLMLAAVVVPVLRGVGEGQPLRAAARRFGFATLGAFIILIATGVAMASHLHRWSDSTLQVKLGLVVLVALLIHLHMRRPQWHAVDAAIFLTSLAIVWLGIVVAG